MTCADPAEILIALELRGVPHGEPGHNTVFDHAEIWACASFEHGRLESFSHDCFHPPWDEEWDMSWSWDIAADSLAVARTAFAECPSRLDPACPCPPHRSLRDRWGWGGHEPGVTSVAIRVVDGLPRFVRDSPKPAAGSGGYGPVSSPGD